MYTKLKCLKCFCNYFEEALMHFWRISNNFMNRVLIDLVLNYMTHCFWSSPRNHKTHVTDSKI